MQITELDLDRAIAAKRSFFQSACTGDCNQGRLCNCQPAPAEAATEIGANHDARSVAVFWSTYLFALLFVAVVAGIASLT